jgi:hypothetical protein
VIAAVALVVAALGRRRRAPESAHDAAAVTAPDRSTVAAQDRP